MKNKITANVSLKIISLLLATLLWLIVRNINDPTVSRTFRNIPVKLLHTELITGSGQVYEVLEDTDVIDRVTVVAPQSVFDTLNTTNIMATADISELSSLDTISIKLTTNSEKNNMIERITGSNDTVKLNIETSTNKTLALKTSVSGKVEEGYLVGDVSPDQNLVRISGPESAVVQVVKAAVDIPVTGFTSDISDNAEIKLYDSDNNLIQDSRITQNIKTVGVKVTIYRTVEVPVIFSVTGTPATGYRVAGEPQANIGSVIVAGRESVLKNLSVVEIPADAIDITDKTQDFTEKISLRDYLPNNTFLADTNQSNIEITVLIRPEITKRLEVQSSRVETINVPDGYRATLQEFEENITISVRGLSEDVSGLRSSEMRGYIDVGKWMQEKNMEEPIEGFYQVEIDFGLSRNVSLEEPVRVMMHLSKVEE